MITPLALAHPSLTAAREVRSWAELPVLDRLDGLGPALDAWASLEADFGDVAGAQVHRNLRAIALGAANTGTFAAHAIRTEQLRQLAPADIRPVLVDIDSGVAAWIKGDVEGLFQAEDAWVKAAQNDSLARLPPPLTLSLLCDGVSLHEASYDARPDPRTLAFLVKLLDMVIAAFRSSDAMPPACRVNLDPRLSRFVGRLAVGHRQLHEVSDGADSNYDLDRAESLLATALSLVHPLAPDHPMWRLEGAIMMGYREPTGDVKGVLSEVAAAEPRGSGLRIRALDLCAKVAWSVYFQSPQHSQSEQLDNAINAWRKAIAELGEPPTSMTRQLGTALIARFNNRGRREDADEALRVLGAADSGALAARLLDVITPELGRYSTDLVDFGISAMTQFVGDPEAASLAEALAVLAGLLADHAPHLDLRRQLNVRIALLESAVRLDDSPAMSARANDLAVALASRFVVEGNFDDLNRSIDTAHSAATASGANPTDRATALNTLGAAAMHRYEATGDLDDLSGAIAVLRKASRAATVLDTSPRVKTLCNLVSALLSRARRLPMGEDLKEARRLSQRATRLATTGDAETRAAARNAVAQVGYEEWTQSGSASDLDGPIAAWRETLALDVPEQRALASYNLGNALLSRGGQGDADEAVPLLACAVRSLDRGLPDAALAANRFAEALQRSANGLRDAKVVARRRHLATRWGTIAMRWAVRASPEMALRVAWDSAFRAEEVEAWGLAADAYSVAIQAVHLLVSANRLVSAKDNWLDMAFGVATRCAYAMFRDNRPEDAVLALEQGRGLVLREVLDRRDPQEIPDLDFNELRESLVQPLLYLVPGRAGGVGILVTPERPAPECLSIAELTETKLGARVRSFHSSAADADGNPLAWQRTLDRICTWLGDMLEPVIAFVPNGRVTLVPTGALSFLPIHASRTSAGVWGFTDSHIVEYAPTALSLIAARRQPAPAAENTLLTIVNPRPTSVAELPFAKHEALAAALASGDASSISGPGATIENVLFELPGRTIIHFACHGIANMMNPRASGVVLAEDKVLSVSALADVNLAAAKLAVLSACETAIPGAGAPDEVTTLGSAFFAAGVDGVISSLWQVPDFSTLLVTILLYDRLRSGLDAALALSEAQRQLRDQTNSQLLRHFHMLRDSALLPVMTFEQIAKELSAGQPNDRDFSGSDSWAGFTFSGFAL